MNTSYQTLNVDKEGPVITLWLNRPEVHNAMNGRMMEEILDFFTEVAGEVSCRLVVLRGKGASFCSGADLHWMKDVSGFDYEQNFQESLVLGRCIQAVYNCPKPVVCLVHGSVMGGANGLIAAADVVIALEGTRFRFSEVSLGLVPAVISPYVVRKTGYSQALNLMLTAAAFWAEEALTLGLIHKVVAQEEQQVTLDDLITKLLGNSPQAIASTKKLLHEISGMNDPEELIRHTAGVIARARVSEDGQKGLSAFFSGEKPEWVPGIEKNKNQVN